MIFFSIGSVLTLVLVCYLGNTLWTLIEMFTAPQCRKGERCISSYLASRPTQHLVLYTSLVPRPSSDRVTKVHTVSNFDYMRPQQFELQLNLMGRRNNGSVYLQVALLDEGELYYSFDTLSTTLSVPLVTYMEPQAATFNLLNHKNDADLKKAAKTDHTRPISHINTHVEFSILTDDLQMPADKIPPEFYPFLKIRNTHFLPMIQHNILKFRLKNLKPLYKTTDAVNITVSYSPISYGMLRLMRHIQLTFHHLRAMGFGDKDVDDVKGIFADTNLYLLCATIIIASFHLLFDFLAFKNDVSFWRRKKSMAGLSARTVLWRGFSTCVILLYLMDENTSLIVLVPAFISAIIELWKCMKVLHVQVEWGGWTQRPRLSFGGARDSQAEQRTRAVDAEAMRYLSYLLYPLCVAGAIYSLLYEPHKSWYSWSVHSLVNGVYALGFLFMLPQLFVNYRLRSVAALPWRAFMYKAFNTFIDDVFAFIITMPTAHRVACFRDDIVFLIYLYQRWLYPVDKSRTDDSVYMDEATLEPVKAKKE